MKAFFVLLIGLVSIANQVRAQVTDENCPFLECTCRNLLGTGISIDCKPFTTVEKFPTRNDQFNTSIIIHWMTITNYKFSAIPSNVFSGLRIRTLLFVNNDLKTIQEDSFNGIIGLEDLQITQQNVETVQPKSLDPIRTTLTRMGLQNDQTAKSILSDSAATFTKLNQLDLNSLTQLNPNMFTNLPELTYLSLLSVPNIFDNPLTGYFTKNPKLVWISLSSNEIRSMSNVLGWLDNVKGQIQHLDLSNNQIEQIPEEINSFSKLGKLYLTANSIRSITNTTFRGLIELNTLLLNLNQIRSSRDVFKYNKKLEYVDLSNNLFSEIHDFTGTRVNWLSYDNQSVNLVELKDYGFDYPRSDSAKSLSLHFTSNDITKFGSRVFCSRTEPEKNLVYISQFDIDYKPLNRMDLCLFRQMGLRNGKNESTNMYVMYGTNEPDNYMCKCEYFEFLRRYNINLQLFGCAINSICKDAVSSIYLDGLDRDCEAKEEFQCLNSNGGNSNSSLSNFGLNAFILNICLFMSFIFRYIQI